MSVLKAGVSLTHKPVFVSCWWGEWERGIRLLEKKQKGTNGLSGRVGGRGGEVGFGSCG